MSEVGVPQNIGKVKVARYEGAGDVKRQGIFRRREVETILDSYSNQPIGQEIRRRKGNTETITQEVQGKVEHVWETTRDKDGMPERVVIYKGSKDAKDGKGQLLQIKQRDSHGGWSVKEDFDKKGDPRYEVRYDKDGNKIYEREVHETEENGRVAGREIKRFNKTQYRTETAKITESYDMHGEMYFHHEETKDVIRAENGRTRVEEGSSSWNRTGIRYENGRKIESFTSTRDASENGVHFFSSSSTGEVHYDIKDRPVLHKAEISRKMHGNHQVVNQSTETSYYDVPQDPKGRMRFVQTTENDNLVSTTEYTLRNNEYHKRTIKKYKEGKETGVAHERWNGHEWVPDENPNGSGIDRRKFLKVAAGGAVAVAGGKYLQQNGTDGIQDAASRFARLAEEGLDAINGDSVPDSQSASASEAPTATPVSEQPTVAPEPTQTPESDGLAEIGKIENINQLYGRSLRITHVDAPNHPGYRQVRADVVDGVSPTISQGTLTDHQFAFIPNSGIIPSGDQLRKPENTVYAFSGPEVNYETMIPVPVDAAQSVYLEPVVGADYDVLNNDGGIHPSTHVTISYMENGQRERAVVGNWARVVNKEGKHMTLKDGRIVEITNPQSEKPLYIPRI
jgi:hypothetical protein